MLEKEKLITDVQFEEVLGERYLAYALSTIKSRSLPDVRDGLKPVHRRLIYAMMQLRLDPKSGFKKCARVVGDVIGKYHPHGDQAVYDAMVRLAQTFSSRYPIVEGQGNFGSIDGDSQAAMRYTEARLTPYALLLLSDLNQDTVDFKDNYDGSDSEPVVLPAMVPNILANGTEGIAVGMATSIPPHNLTELCEALLHLVKNPQAEIAELMEYVQGPDFPTGGVLVESKDNIIKAYTTGRGSFRIRAKWHAEEQGRGQYNIVITEIPYQVVKRNLIEKMAELYNAKKIPFVEDFQDLSAEDIRIVITPKSRNIEPEVVMESLFKLTDLETRFHLNMNVLHEGVTPGVMGLKEVLVTFLHHRREVVVRRLNNRLLQINHRLEVLDGLLIAYLNLLEVIEVIREEDKPKEVMMQRWQLTDLQAESILNMKLRSLRKLEEFEIRSEHTGLSNEKAEIEDTLANEKKQWNLIVREIKSIPKLLKDDPTLLDRRTIVEEAQEIAAVDPDVFINKEPVSIVFSKMGWLRAIKGHNSSNIKYKEGDEEHTIIKAQTTDKILFFSNHGKFYTLVADNINRGKGFGEPLRLIVDMEAGEEIISMFKFRSEEKLLLASNDGKGFIIDADDVLASTKKGKQILNCDAGTGLICTPVYSDTVAVLGANRKLLIFPVSEIPEMKRGKGVTLQKYKNGTLYDLMLFNKAEGLCWERTTRKVFMKNEEIFYGKRGGSGRVVMGKLWVD
jgi:topoisomerase-4 subunit A